MKRYLIAASLAVLASACATDEEVPPPEAMVPAGMATAIYVPAAASGDLLEIQAGQLALQRSCDPTVRDYAQHIIGDHTRLSNDMAAAIQAAGLPPAPRLLAPPHQAAFDRLAAATGPAFEAEFRDGQIAAHQEALALHQGYAQDGEHAPLRAVAATAIPVIQTHLDHAHRLPTMAQCNLPPPPGRGERG